MSSTRVRPPMPARPSRPPTPAPPATTGWSDGEETRVAPGRGTSRSRSQGRARIHRVHHRLLRTPLPDRTARARGQARRRPAVRRRTVEGAATRHSPSAPPARRGRHPGPRSAPPRTSSGRSASPLRTSSTVALHVDHRLVHLVLPGGVEEATRPSSENRLPVLALPLELGAADRRDAVVLAVRACSEGTTYDVSAARGVEQRSVP